MLLESARLQYGRAQGPFAADRYGLNRTDMRGLDLIGQAGPLAPTELVRLLGFTTGGITTVIDRLG
jgi:DNA-binding MarR family transcriptional regulator